MSQSLVLKKMVKNQVLFMNQQELQPKAIAEVEEPMRSYVKWAGVL